MGDAKAAVVPMEVQWAPAWLTWVAATTTCLRALGVDCDQADVAGLSGYAFVLNVHQELCPSGPTAFDWRPLTEGVSFLGRSTQEFGGPGSDLRGGYEFAAGEIAAGRPCVIWGAYVPEFAAAIGVEDGAFLVRSFREMRGEPQPPIPCDELQAPGGPYVLAFPEPVAADRAAGDRHAIARAATIRTAPSGGWDYGHGLAGYDTWIAALEAGIANPFGYAYNTQCYAEGRRFAHEFLSRVARRNPDFSEPADRAADAYGEAADAMGEMSMLFPFPDGGRISEQSVRDKAIACLRAAEAAETRAAEALAEAAATWQ
jgi:hypothetical protein